MEIEDYKIVTGINFDDLAANVRKDMVFGWIPQGGVNRAGASYAQAMIKPMEDRGVVDILQYENMVNSKQTGWET